jgi:hypothetical protein
LYFNEFPIVVYPNVENAVPDIIAAGVELGKHKKK